MRGRGWVRALAVAAMLAAAPVGAAPLTYKEMLARPVPTATAKLSYGPLPQQFGELWLPDGAGPHPLVVLVHGGCWQASIPAFALMNHMAEALRKEGIAVWNVEYRRLGEDGGGYPGSFADVATSLDHVRALAGPHRLDPGRVVLAGHSAGGHLALWAAARHRLPAGSPLYAADPLPVRKVVTLAGINDLADYRARGPNCGGAETVEALVGFTGRGGAAAFADTSPAALLPLGVPQVVVSGSLDRIVPDSFGRAYANLAAAAGDRVRQVTLPEAGHFELVDPASGAWPVLLEALRP